MHRALSAEHLADFAHQAVSSLKRLVTSSSFLDPHASWTPSQQDLLSTSKQIEDYDKKTVGGSQRPSSSSSIGGGGLHHSIDLSVVELWAKSFSEELDHLTLAFSQGSDGGPPSASSQHLIPASPKAASVATLPGAASTLRKPLSEAQLTQCFECSRIVNRAFGVQALEVMTQSTQLLPKLISALRISGALPKRAAEALQMALQDILGDVPGALKEGLTSLTMMIRFGGVMEPSTVASVVASTEPHHHGDEVAARFVTPTHLRYLQLLIHVLRRSDLLPSRQTVLEPAEDRHELLHVLLQQLRDMLRSASECDTTPKGRVVTSATLTLISIFSLVQGNGTLKATFLAQPDAKSLWVWVANHVQKMDTIITYTATLGANGKSEDRVLSLEHPNATWAAEVAEMLVELCTTDSFCLRRQSLYIVEAAAPPTPPNVGASTAAHIGRSGASGSSGSLAVTSTRSSSLASHHQQRWEPLPANWDSILTSGSPLVWQFAAALAHCQLDTPSVRSLFSFLAALDTAAASATLSHAATSPNATAEFIFRCVASSLLLLCSACPTNAAVLSDAGAFHMLVELLTAPTVTVFPIRTDMSLRHEIASVAGEMASSDSGAASNLCSGSVMVGVVGESCRQLLFSILSVLVATHLRPQDISMLMCAVESMRTRETTLEDCQIVEHVLHTAGATTYSRSPMFFGGGSAMAISHVDKFVGRWYGYTFMTWIHPLCIWGDGNAIFSFAEASTPSAVVVCVVANGRSRSLVVRMTNGKEFSIFLLPDTALSTDGWSHITFVHNISGFVVFINGKRVTSSTSLPFPKEPTKPHKLMFGLGCDCSDRCDSSNGGASPFSSATSTAGGANSSSSPAKPQQATSYTPRTVSPFFGYVCGMEVLDGAVGDKDIERIAAAGPLPSSTCVEPSHSNVVLLGLTRSQQVSSAAGNVSDATAAGTKNGSVEITGSSLPRKAASSVDTKTASGGPTFAVHNVTALAVPNVPLSFASLGVVSWATDVILKTVEDRYDSTSMASSSTSAVTPNPDALRVNRNIIAVLCLEFMSTAFKVGSIEELNKYHDLGVIQEVRRAFLQWDSGIPPEFANSLISVAVPRGSSNKHLRPHPTTAVILDTVIDMLNSPLAMSSFFGATLKDLSELLSSPENAKLFREKTTRFSALLLASTSYMPTESVTDLVALLEKLCKESLELEQLLRFVAFSYDDAVRSGAPALLHPGVGHKQRVTTAASHRHMEFVICEILRMLYDVARPNPAMCELIANACGGMGIWWLLYLIQAPRHGSEAVRICSTKLLALVLHSSKRARELFLKANGFELLAVAVAPPQAVSNTPLGSDGAAAPLTPLWQKQPQQAPSVRLMTYNCFYKFALDFYTPNNTNAHGGTVLIGSSARASSQGGHPQQAQGGGGFGFHGHMPGVLPTRTNRRGMSVDLGYGSDCGDVEGRLSVDDIYSEQAGASKDVLVYPQGVQVVLQLLGTSVRHLLDTEANFGPGGDAGMYALTPQMSMETPESGGDGGYMTPPVIGAERSQVSVANSVLSDQAELIVKVLTFLDRIVDVTPNAVALAGQPWWLESLWTAVESLLAPPPEPPAASSSTTRPSASSASSLPPAANDNASSIARGSNGSSALRHQLRTEVDAVLRSIIRKVSVVDLTRQTKALTVRRLKELVDIPILQRMVLEEVVRHFSQHNRMDMMDPSEANNCIRNLDSLLQGVDDCIAPFPNPLAVEIVFAIRAIVVNNNTWVRLKMKNSTKLFEVRDRLAFSLMTSIKDFSKEHAAFLPQLIEVNVQDGNTLVVVLKNIVDAVSNRNLEEVETLQSMLRILYSTDDDQRKSLQKLLESDAVELLQQRDNVTDKQPSTSTALETDPSGTAAPPAGATQDFISWCMLHEAKWESMVQKILKAYRPVDAEVRAVTEKRDKERTARIKSRKAELEKRALSSAKSIQEVERLRNEIESKGLQMYRDARDEAHGTLTTPAAMVDDIAQAESGTSSTLPPSMSQSGVATQT